MSWKLRNFITVGIIVSIVVLCIFAMSFFKVYHCTECGAQIQYPIVKYCPFCGEKLDSVLYYNAWNTPEKFKKKQE
jgi:endogenous inhibitor of DNA gyrase (YacG/DUF329 family)